MSKNKLQYVHDYKQILHHIVTELYKSYSNFYRLISAICVTKLPFHMNESKPVH